MKQNGLLLRVKSITFAADEIRKSQKMSCKSAVFLMFLMIMMWRFLCNKVRCS